MNRNINTSNPNFQFQYQNISENNEIKTNKYNIIDFNKNLNLKEDNKYRINILEDRISSLEKMLHYLDEFIHLKEEEKNNDFQNNLMIDQLNVKIDLLEKEIKILHQEKIENQKTIVEMNNKILNLERQINNNNYNNMQDIIFSMSNKERKLNMLIDEFQDMNKNSDLIINNKLTEKINKFKKIIIKTTKNLDNSDRF